jgi:phosphoribosylformimino-5-aminoimidazole carboxamide ribotide isomerase
VPSGCTLSIWTAEQILTTSLQVQFGGGLRDLRGIRRVLDLGVSRAVIGTVAVEDPDTVKTSLKIFGPERIAVGIDTRRGRVRTHGWSLATPLPAPALAHRSAAQGVRWIIFTDIDRDGMGSGLNLEMTTQLAQATDLNVIAAGGVASLEDVHRAFEAGLSGVIIGRALYEGLIDLEDALRVGMTSE